jgi:predicted DNA-binding protein with PD1-like motif
MPERGHEVLTRRNFLGACGLGVAAMGMPSLARSAAVETGPAPPFTVVSEQEGVKTYLLVFDKGQEVMAGLLAFAREQKLIGGSIQGIGAVSDAVLAFFDRKKLAYVPNPIREQAEVGSLLGNLALDNGEPFLHVHAALGLPDGSARVGHLLEAHVWPTLEVVVTAWTARIQRKRDAQTGLELLHP